MTCMQRIKQALNKVNIKENSIDELVVLAYWMGIESVTNNGNCTNTEGQRKWKGIKNE